MEPFRICGRMVSFDVMVSLVVVVAAILVLLFVFVGALPNATAIITRHDNQTHLNNARAFCESGRWSSLHADSYLAMDPSQCPLAVQSHFYPSAWTDLVALVCLASRIDLMVAVNAVVALCACLVFPLGCYAFLRVLLPHRRQGLMLSALAIVGFATWPWLFVYSGPLFPNQLGISLQVCAMAPILAVLESGSARNEVPRLATLALISFVALALTHPSTIFSCYVLLSAWGAHVLRSLYRGRTRIIALALYSLAVVGFWILCLHLPALSSTVGYSEVNGSTIVDSILDIALMRFFFTTAQPGLAILGALGIICAFRDRYRRWLIVPVAFYALGYLSSRMDWWPFANWIAAFWYTDWRRMAANLIVSLIPFVVLGLDGLLQLTRLETADREVSTIRTISPLRLAVTVAIIVLAFIPTATLSSPDIPKDTPKSIQPPFGTVRDLLATRYAERIYGPEEIAFVNRARDIVPDDALVINAPADGSMWSYGVNGLRTYYHSITFAGQKPQSDIVRLHLCEYASNAEVRDAVAQIGATYVLLLDKGVSHEQGHWIWQFDKSQVKEWEGITSIGDSTPGFKTVLSEGDEMRLYRIG
ncbi:MAG: hypothetical protein IKF78_02910 [Atopobiaceae bacterium]|nr:hypothetical protein [Atopobiaceae bacterium]